MGSARTPYTGGAVVDVEAGPVDAAAIKAAGLVAEKFYDDREYARIDADLADFVVDDDTTRTRAARDRDRAFPRDMSQVNPRKQRELPAPGSFRATLSSRQRKDRSAAKRRVIDDAPTTSIATTAALVSTPAQWAHLNTALREATGNAQHLADPDRRTVQRVDRMIQAYERGTDRGHVVYAAVTLPTDTPIRHARDIPDTLAPGARISFDQFTMASHTLHDAVAAADRHTTRSDLPPASATTVVLEIQTSRGMYLGRSDSVDDTSHLLPRGMALQVASIDTRADYAAPGGHGSTIVVQLRDATRSVDYTPPVAGRRARQQSRANAAVRADDDSGGPQ